MKILFSPSEAKYRGGTTQPIDKSCYIFPELFDKRMEMINLYREYIQREDRDSLKKLLGTKKEDIVDYYSTDILTKETQRAIDRYDGVAYNYLDYSSLNDTQKRYIDTNLLIFSNLFGAILAGDEGLPDYKLKQGEKIDGISIERFYRDNFSDAIDEFLLDEDCLDLRAGFYTKFYKPSKEYSTLKFIKEGKVISHWAKAYRGVVLRELALKDIESIDELIDTSIPNLSLKDIITKGSHREIIYEIEAI